MKKQQFVLSASCFYFFLGVQTPQFAQDTSAGPAKADQERRMSQSAFSEQSTQPK